MFWRGDEINQNQLGNEKWVANVAGRKKIKVCFKNFSKKTFIFWNILKPTKDLAAERKRISSVKVQVSQLNTCLYLSPLYFQPLDLAMQNKYDQTINQDNHADDDNWAPKRPSIRLSLQL